MLIKFTSKTIEEVNDEIAQALKSIGSKHGFDVKMSNLRFSDVSAFMEVQLVLNNLERTKALEKSKREVFVSVAEKLNIDTSLYGKSFTVSDITYTVVGIDEVKEFPIIVKNHKGDLFNMSVISLNKMFEGNNNEA